MKQSLSSSMSSLALTGLLVLMPLGIIFLILVEVYQLLEETAAFAQLELPFPGFVNALLYIAALLAGLYLLCLVAGLLLSTGLGQRFADLVRTRIADNIPFLKFLRNLTLNIAGDSGGDVRAVEVNLYNNDVAVLALLMETLPDGRRVVYVPSAPAVTMGAVHVVSAERVKLLDVSVAAIANTVSQWGLGASDTYAGSAPPPRDEIEETVARPD